MGSTPVNQIGSNPFPKANQKSNPSQSLRIQKISVSPCLRGEMDFRMAKRVSVDRLLFIVTLLLVFVGLVMVFSASAVMAKERYHSGYFFLTRQMGWAVAGFIAMMVGMRVDYKRLKHPAVVFSLIAMTPVMLV